MESVLFKLLRNGKFADLQEHFASKDKKNLTGPELEIWAFLNFQVGKAPESQIKKFHNSFYYLLWITRDIWCRTQAGLNVLLIVLGRILNWPAASRERVSIKEYELMAKAIPNRYYDFKNGFVRSVFLAAISMRRGDKLREAVYKSYIGHFLVLNGRVRLGLILLRESAELLEKYYKENPSSENIYIYFTESLGMLGFNLGFLGNFDESSEVYDKALLYLREKRYFWVELFIRSMRMNESFNRLDTETLLQDIRCVQKEMGKAVSTKFALRSRIYSSLLLAYKGDRAPATGLVSQIALEHERTSSYIELGRFASLLALLWLEMENFHKSLEAVRKSLFYFSQVPGAKFHYMEAQVLEVEIHLRSLNAVSMVPGVQLKNLQSKLRQLKLQSDGSKLLQTKITALMAVCRALQGDWENLNADILGISESDLRNFKRFFSSISVIVPFGLKSHGELGIDTAEISEKKLWDIYTDLLNPRVSETESLTKLFSVLFGVSGIDISIEFRPLSRGNVDLRSDGLRWTRNSEDQLEMVFTFSESQLRVQISSPLRDPEWDAPLRKDLLSLYRLLSLISERDSHHREDKDKALYAQAQQVVHDLQSPLQMMHFALGRLSLDESPDVQLLQKCVDRMKSVAGDLLGGLKSESHAVTTIWQNLVEIIEDKREEFRNYKGIQIQFVNHLKEDALVPLSRAELYRVVSSLVNNARESYEGGVGEIVVQLCVNTINGTPKIQILISDQGVGMSESVMTHLGSRGFSKGKQSFSMAGSGLGVSGSKSILENVGGSLTYESELEKGTQALIVLPILTSNSFGEVVLIDDDPLVRSCWLDFYSLYLRNIHFSSYSCLEDFNASSKKHSLNAAVFMDWDLPSAPSKDQGLKLIYGLGFKHVYICTGHSQKYMLDQKHMVQAIVGKTPYAPVILKTTGDVQIPSVNGPLN